jgi:hypothetical protein
MTQIVTNIIQNSLSGFVAGAVTTVGEYAGDAVSGIGNLIDQKGKGVGDGIAKKFDGWGQGISGYGNAVRNATAPNARGAAVPVKKTAVKKIESGGKPTSAPKKAITAPPERKLLMPPPAKEKATYANSVAPFKVKNSPKSSYAPSTATAATSKTVKPRTTYARSEASAVKKVGSTAPGAKTSTGKVIPDKKSLPGYKGPSASAYKGPIPVGGGSGGNTKKPVGGYAGPLNLGGLTDTGNSKPKASTNKPAPSVAGSVAGSNSKPKSGKYQGPINLGGLA